MYVPVLMYHDIGVEQSSCKSSGCAMMPKYNISTEMFEEQMKILSDMGYDCPSLANVSSLLPMRKYVVLTFDDGLIGNYINALPILKKYNFCGNFFVTTGAIGTSRFMTWKHLETLIDEGMYVQSHTVSHSSLEIQTSEQIRYELGESKRCLENKLGIKINGISFPHGSYNRNVMSIAVEEGYETILTSDVKRETHNSFLRPPIILGRFAITDDIDIPSFVKIVRGVKLEYFKRKALKQTKNFVKRMLGVNGYRLIYRYIFNIKK